MEYINAQNAGKMWGVSVQTVLKYCGDGLIDGAFKKGKSWMIPENATIPLKRNKKVSSGFSFIDLFCGIGGFHQAMRSLGGKCVFACDINAQCRDVYKRIMCFLRR